MIYDFTLCLLNGFWCGKRRQQYKYSLSYLLPRVFQHAEKFFFGSVLDVSKLSDGVSMTERVVEASSLSGKAATGGVKKKGRVVASRLYETTASHRAKAVPAKVPNQSHYNSLRY